jgi:hypothetical protein
MCGHLEGMERTPCQGSLKWNASKSTYNNYNKKKNMMQIMWMSQKFSREKKYIFIFIGIEKIWPAIES